MTKKITIWSTKGGVGKTSICAELHFRLGYPVVTNEKYSMLDRIIDPNNIKILKQNEKIQNYDNSMLFDFGGYIDARIVDAVRQSDLIIVPTSNSDLDIQGSIDTVYTLQKYSIPIIIIINRVRNVNECQYTIDSISNIGKYDFFFINESKVLLNIFRKKISIIKTVENKFMKYVCRNIHKQFNDIISYIKNM